MAEEIDFTDVVAELRQNFEDGVIRSFDARFKQLSQLNLLIEENEEALIAAVYKDLHKCKYEALIGEIFVALQEVRGAMNNLEGWMRPEKVTADLINMMNICEIQRDPLGVVLVIGAWNYPIVLALQPLVGALAAGNCVILKPSEVSVHTATLVHELISRYLDPACIRVINGGVPESTALLRCRFDHIMYTGGTSIGKIIMRAASEHLTPVTLELGGKSPAIVDTTCDFELVGQRIVWGKLFNNGQTCLAVDYVICIGGCQDLLLDGIKKAIVKFFGENPKQSESYGRIINTRHFQRLCNMIDDSKVVYGNVKDEDDLYISPTIMTNVTADDKVMQDEIFGPILALIDHATIEDAIKFIRAREKPLVIYMFSKHKRTIQMVKTQTSSGGMVVNDVLIHFAVPSLPFGGVGHSGMGAYHGKYSFDCFSHKKSFVQTKQVMESAQRIRYAPYDSTSKVLTFLRWILIPSLKRRGIQKSNIFILFLLISGASVILACLNNYLM